MKRIALFGVAVAVAATVRVTAALETPYVTEGLVAMWDAIENVGPGLPHDNAATTWVNLVDPSKYGLTWLPITSGAGCLWLDDAAKFTRANLADTGWQGNGSWRYSGFPYASLMGTSWTIEASVVPDEEYFSNYSGICGNAGGGNLPTFSENENGVSCFRVFPVRGEPGTIELDPELTPVGELQTISYSDSPETASVWVNAIQAGRIANGSPLNSTLGNSGDFYIGSCYGRNADRTFDGKVHCVRVYNRVLTDDERTQNYYADAFRFGGAAVTNTLEVVGDPSDFAVGSVTPAYGVHQGRIACGKIVFSAPSGAITLQFSSTEVSNVTATGWTLYTKDAATEDWQEFDSGTTTEGSFRMPNAPTKFVWHWKIEEASDFRSEDALPPYAQREAYPQAGLYAHWDAIANTKAGSLIGHRSTARVWSDCAGLHNLEYTGKGSPQWADDGYVSSKDVVQCMFCNDPAFFTSLGDKWSIQAYVTPGEKWFADSTAICGNHALDNSKGLCFGQRSKDDIACTIFGNNAEQTRLSMVKQSVLDALGGIGRSILLTMTASPTSCRLYLNDRLVQEVATVRTGDTALTAPGFYVGNSFNNFTSGYIFDGRIHSVRVYSRELTGEEVGTSYAVDCNRFARRVVSDYEFLEWIRPDGQASINTGLLPRQRTIAEAEFTAPDNPQTANIFGTEHSAQGYLLNFTEGKIRFHSGNSYEDVAAGDVWQNGGLVRFRATNFGFDVNGHRTSLSPTKGNTQNAISVFKVGPFVGAAAIKLHHLRFLDGDNRPLLDFHPARQISTAAVGLYDVVGGRFFGVSSGSVEAGPRISDGGTPRFSVCPRAVWQTAADFQVVPLSFGDDLVNVKAVLSGGGKTVTRDVARFSSADNSVAASLTGLQPDTDYQVSFSDETGAWTWPTNGARIAFRTLPKDAWSNTFQPLEYIESTQLENIDTLVQATKTLAVDMQASLRTSTYGASGVGAVFGSAWNATGFLMNYGADYLRFHSGGVYDDVVPSPTTWQPEERVRLIGTYAGFGVNGTWTPLAAQGDNSRTGNIILFSTATIMGDPVRGVSAGVFKLYQCTVSNVLGGVIRDYQPVRRRSDGVLGLFDRVTGEFHYADGFIAGPRLKRKGLLLFVQ